MNHSHKYINDLQLTLSRLPVNLIDQVITLLHDARLRNRQVFIMGNGGSASTASHFVCDLGKNTRRAGWPNFRVIGLTDNMAMFSALANDEGYENVFAQQLASFVQPGDIVIGISTSGNSANVVNAIKLANNMGAKTVGFTGFDCGRLGSLVDINLHVPSNSIEQVEDIHLMLEHLICSALFASTSDERIFNQVFLPYFDAFGRKYGGIHKETRDGLESVGSVRNGQKRIVQDLIFNLNRELDMSLDQFGLLQRVLQFCVKHLGAVSGSVLLFSGCEEVSCAAVAYMDKVEVSKVQNLEDIVEQGLAGWVVRNRQPVLLQDTLSDDRWLKRPWEEKNGPRSAVSVPLITSDKIFGVLTLAHTNVDWFTQSDLALLASVAMYTSVLALTPHDVATS